MRYQRTTGFWLTGVIAAVSLGLVALPSPNTAMADPSTTQTTHVDCSSSASGDGSIDHPVNGVDKLDKAFGPGKRVLFKRGTTCRGTVVVNASGTNHARTLIGAYGQGKAPHPRRTGIGHEPAFGDRGRRSVAHHHPGSHGAQRVVQQYLSRGP